MSAVVFVEYAPQTRIEGDIQQLPADFPVTKMWRVLAGIASGRDSAAQVTIFDSVGFAIEDFSALRFVRDQAELRGIGRQLALISALGDPKDLYQMIAPPALKLAVNG